MKKRILFLLHEGVGPTIFQSQVMEHAVCMAGHDIEIEVLSYETFASERAASENNLAAVRTRYPGVPVRLINGTNIYLPGATLANAARLVAFLRATRGRYALIHARADYSAALALLTRPFHGLPVVWDCRGDAVGELADSLSRKSAPLRATLGRVLLWRQRAIAALCRRFADGAIFVSDALYAQHREYLATYNVAIVACPVPADKFFFDQALRAAARAAAGIAARQRVYVYSGSVVAYQGLSEQAALYAKLLDNPDNLIYFATSGPEQARQAFPNFDPQRFRIVSVGYGQVNEIYNLSDFAFMLREPKHLNWVASPTKFGEYCLTGLPVILNDTVQQAAANARLIGNYVAVADVAAAAVHDDATRATTAAGARKLYARDASATLYTGIYQNAIVPRPCGRTRVPDLPSQKNHDR